MNLLQQLFSYVLTCSFLGTVFFLLFYGFHLRTYQENTLSYSWIYGECKLILLLYLLPFFSVSEWIYQQMPSSFWRFIPFFKEVGEKTPENTLNFSNTTILRPPSETLPPITSTLEEPTFSTIPTEVVETLTEGGDVLETMDISVVLSQISHVLPLIWGIAVLGLSLSTFISWKKWHSLVKTATIVQEGREVAQLEELRIALNFKKPITLATWNHLETPVLVGGFQKIIILPTQLLWEEMDKENCKEIFLHELHHLKAHDLWWNGVLQVVRILHCFNPLVYLFGKKFREVLEFACDEAVGEGLDFSQRKNYCYALLETVTLEERETNYVHGLGFNHPQTSIERRMNAMLHPKDMKKSTKLYGILLVGTLLLGATTPQAMELGKNAQLAQSVEEALLQVEYVTEPEVYVHKNGRVFIKVMNFHHLGYEGTVAKEREIEKFVAEVCGVEVQDVYWYQDDYSVKEVNKDRDTWLAERTTVKSYEVYSHSTKDWAYLLDRVEKGNLTMEESSQEEMDFFRLYFSLENHPITASTQYSVGGNEEMPYDMKAKIYQAYDDFGTGSLSTWVVGEESETGELYFEVTFYHRETGEYLVSVDGGETWIAHDPEEYSIYQEERYNNFYETPEISQEQLEFEAFVESLPNTPSGYTISYPQEKFNERDTLWSGEVEFPEFSYEMRRNLYQSYNDFGTGTITIEYLENENEVGTFTMEMQHRDTGKTITSTDGVNWQ